MIEADYDDPFYLCCWSVVVSINLIERYHKNINLFHFKLCTKWFNAFLFYVVIVSKKGFSFPISFFFPAVHKINGVKVHL